MSDTSQEFTKEHLSFGFELEGEFKKTLPDLLDRKFGISQDNRDDQDNWAADGSVRHLCDQL